MGICREYMDADGSMKALFSADAADDVVEKTVTIIKEKLVAAFDARFADGRKFAAGENPAAADFQLACYVTRIMANPNAKNPKVPAAVKEAFEGAENLQRVINNIRGLNGIADAMDNITGAY